MADGTFEPVTGAPAGLNASSRPPPRPSGAAPDRLRPSGQPEGERPPQVDGGAQGLQLHVVARQAAVAYPPVAVGPLHGREQPLDAGPDRRYRLVERRLPRLERPVAPRLVHDPRLDAPLAEPGPPRLAVVGLVGVDRFLVALDEIVGRDAVVDVRGRHHRLADQPAALVDRGVRLVAEPAPAVLLRPPRLRVARRHLAGLARRRPHRRLEDGGVDQRAPAQDQSLRVQLPVDLGQERLGQAALRQPLPEAPDRAVVGDALGQRDAGEAAEREPVVDRRLQALVRQPVPLLEQQQLDAGQQRVGQPTLPAGVDAGDDPLQGRPVQRPIQALEPLALLAAPPHDAVCQAKLPKVTPRHRLTPAPFPTLNQKLAGRAKVSGYETLVKRWSALRMTAERPARRTSGKRSSAGKVSDAPAPEGT